MVSTWQLYKLYINRPPSRPASCDSSCSIWEENTRHIAKQSVKSRLPTSWPGRWTGLPNVKYNTEQLLLMCTHHTYRGIIFFIWCALLLKHNISYIQNIHLTYKACHREIKPPTQTALKDNSKEATNTRQFGNYISKVEHLCARQQTNMSSRVQYFTNNAWQHLHGIPQVKNGCFSRHPQMK